MKFLSLITPVSDLFMVGKTYSQRLGKLEITTIEELLHHYPHRWEDLSLISKISQVQPGEKVTIQGEIIDSRNIYTKYHKRIQKVIVKDSSGQIEATWFNQPFLPKTLKKGLPVSLAGKVEVFGSKPVLVSPEYELLKGKETIHTGRLVPIYPETYGVSSKWLRSRIAPLIKELTPEITDWLPLEIKKENQLINLKNALKQIHFPNNKQEAGEAKQRLAFDELFLMQLAGLKRKKEWGRHKTTFSLDINQEKVLQFIGSLPFTLTKAQKKAVKEMLNDLNQKKPMNRLLEGDVGSGKTVVAAVGFYVAFLNGFQSALMAPTEILAQQHYNTIKSLLEPFGVKIGLATGSKKINLKNGYDILIGTHALVYNKVNFENLGFVVIDEQHRFGVEQRAKLIKKGKAPHLLTMTATPIPRTIALTMYGDLDLSVLDEMPKGRLTIKTWVVPKQKRAAAYQWIEKQVKDNQSQAFIVCPLIEESEKESMKDIKAAKAEFEKLSRAIFPNLKLALLHGRIKSKEKETIFKDFQDKKTDLLVSTPVVEVGIDIPNATVMMIEASERFGLAQLHQLRGRVGRSSKQSYCLLFTEKKHGGSIRRLQAMEKNHSGFELAEIDLKLRGPGEFYGIHQHGWQKLKIASFSDSDLIIKTRKSAQKVINQLNQFPPLKEKLENYTIRLVEPN